MTFGGDFDIIGDMLQDAAPKSTSLPNLFLLVGLPGSGKTYFADKFACEYKIPFLNLNKWRFAMFDQPTFDRKEDARLTYIASSLLVEIFKTRKSILLEGNLSSRVDRQTYARLARQNGYRPIMIWVQNVKSESKIRSTRLNKSIPKDFLLTPELFDVLASRFTPPNEIERPIVISGKHAFRMQYRSVLKHIVGESSATRRQIDTDILSRKISRRPMVR